MKLSQALASIKGSEKTAAAAPSLMATPPGGITKTATDSTTPSADRLKAALHAALAPNEKQAAATATSVISPLDGITKMASDLAAAEHEAQTKEAHLFGAAVADGAMMRFGQWNEVLQSMVGKVAGFAAPAEKTAGAATNDDSFEKFAAEHQDLVKEAAQVGYDSAMNDMTKLAEAAQIKGYNEAVGEIYKTAHACFVQGYVDTLRTLKALQQ